MEARDVADELGIDYDEDELERLISSLEDAELEAQLEEERDQEQEQEDDDSDEDREDLEVRRLFSMLASDEEYVSPRETPPVAPDGTHETP